MTRSLLTVGECMVEVAPAEGDLFRVGYAGDTLNTAWYARRLLGDDWDVSFATKVGTDAVSDRMVAFFGEVGIGTDAVARHDSRGVGLYMIQLQDGERSFSYWRDTSAARTLGDDPAWLDRVFEGRDLILFSGITLAILSEKGRGALCAALARARAAGSRIAFDTNLRPRLWSGPDEMKSATAEGAAVSDIVLPSFDEETGLHGDGTPDDTIARYRQAGASCVVVKNGTGTLHAWEASEGTLTLDPVPAPKVVDTTAAGDSFNAGFLCPLMQGASLKAAAETAMDLSARVVQGRGALVDVWSEAG
ncbi:2-keto-3-deoxygluconate kinase [Tranquillimonas rosea]|uniref:2-keto-3-deoxygluconate kinase n=1 Tax=Tranquillimonas rosea TaxID=641238 RepID=A0A1H9UE09_9RHOB|nr:sugar kinase [Tranquillimonas rosea]SES07303.1 2-keto-3-deoxygluconate kinase [Tranquillimonas rosea]